MKNKRVTSMLVGAVFAAGLGSSVQAMDTVLYTKLANETISEANSGFVANINHLIRVQEKLVQLGIEGSREYIQSHPEHAKLLNIVIANADKMKTLSLDEIEDQWHSGKFMKSQGFDLEKYDHFGALFSLMDSIIHPATSYIALKEYKRTRKADHLVRTSAELIEVIEHIAHIDDDSPTQLSSNH